MHDDTATHDPRARPDDAGPASASDAMETKYRIDRVIASGGMGVVVAATHRHLGTRVAIKLLHEASDGMRQRFLREAKLAAGFDSPYVARVRDYGFTADAQPFLVMDHLEGRTLKARIDAGPESPAEALRIAREIVLALAEVHRAKIVHRDVKPSNVFLVKDVEGVEHVKLIDFGIAKRISGDDGRASEVGITRTGEVVGTVSYMAAEQMRGSAEIDQRADLFSVGAVLYEMLTGHKAFDAASRGYALAMSSGKQDVAFAPLASLVPGLDPALEAVVLRCLAFDPAARFDSAQALLAALPGQLVSTGSITTSAIAKSSERIHVSTSSRAWLLPIVLAAAGIALTLLIYLGSSGNQALSAAGSASESIENDSPSVSATSVAVLPRISQPNVVPVESAAPSASSAREPRRPPTFVRPQKSAKPRFDERQ